jgi:hypothetical protein
MGTLYENINQAYFTSKIRLKRNVFERGLRLTPVPDGTKYAKFKPKVLYFKPAPTVKYWRFPLSGFS